VLLDHQRDFVAKLTAAIDEVIDPSFCPRQALSINVWAQDKPGVFLFQHAIELSNCSPATKQSEMFLLLQRWFAMAAKLTVATNEVVDRLFRPNAARCLSPNSGLVCKLHDWDTAVASPQRLTVTCTEMKKMNGRGCSVLIGDQDFQRRIKERHSSTVSSSSRSIVTPPPDTHKKRKRQHDKLSHNRKTVAGSGLVCAW
jgi:hypothetical protein